MLFEGQLKKDYEQLIAFNHAITEERQQYLNEELIEIEASIKQINAELNTLGKQRSEKLAFLSGTDAFNKYKQLTNDIVTIKADIASLERQRVLLGRLKELRADIRKLSEETRHLQIQIENNVEQQNSDNDSLFSLIRLYFSNIVEEVIDRKALLSVFPNQLGHLDFNAEIIDNSGNATSAALGHTYRKLMCIAFDMAIVRTYLDRKFPRFIFHDGVFESLDDRKKQNILDVIRNYCNLGIQIIITLIDSDLPSNINRDAMFNKDEIILTLHDEDATGRLFKMKSW